MKNKVNLLVIVELQIVLALLIFVVIRQFTIEEKVFNTNSFLYKVVVDKTLDELKNVSNNDILIGDSEAPLTIVMYTRPGCVHCQDFMGVTFRQLYAEFIETGDVKIVFRYLISAKSDDFKLALNEYASIKKNNNDDSIIEILEGGSFRSSSHYNPNDSIILIEEANRARQGGVFYTPTFIVGTKKIVGDVNIERLRQIINEQLALCE